MSTQHDSILIVDDDPHACSFMIQALKDYPYQVDLAGDGETALALMLQKPYQLVLLDVVLPGLDGLSVCRALKLNHQTRHLPVIFITGKITPQSLADCFSAGGVDYITKPFQPDELAFRVKTHLRLNHMEQELRQQLNLRELMLTSLSHNLRNPVGTSVGLIERLAQSETLSERGKSWSSSALQSGRQAFALLEDVMTWAQAHRQGIQLQPAPIAFADLARECLDFIRVRALQKEIELLFDAPANLKICIDINVVRMILQNLLSNATKFTPRGGRVTLRAYLLAGEVVLEVDDNGPGLPEQVVMALAEKRPLTSSLGTEGERGTGMGLQICREFAEFHGGSLEFEPSPGQGTRVRLRLSQRP